MQHEVLMKNSLQHSCLTLSYELEHTHHTCEAKTVYAQDSSKNTTWKFNAISQKRNMIYNLHLYPFHQSLNNCACLIKYPYCKSTIHRTVEAEYCKQGNILHSLFYSNPFSSCCQWMNLILGNFFFFLLYLNIRQSCLGEFKTGQNNLPMWKGENDRAKNKPIYSINLV